MAKDHSGLSLSLSLSLPIYDQRPERTEEEEEKEEQKKKKKWRRRRLAGGRGLLSCELVLFTPSCIYNNGGLLPQSLLHPPMRSVESSEDSTATLSLSLSLSPPPTNKGEVLAGEEVSASDSTLINSMEVPTELDPAIEDLDLHQTVPGDDEAEGSNPHTLCNARELQQARRGTWQVKVQRLKGTAPLRVLRKRLVSTDISSDHSRFLFTLDEEDKQRLHEEKARQQGQREEDKERGPKKLLDMLTGDEKAAAKVQGGLPVLLLDRWGNEHPGNKLRYWTATHSYVILGKWPAFVRLGELKAGDVVEVYVFRVPPPPVAPAGPPFAGPSSSPPPPPPPPAGAAPSSEEPPAPEPAASVAQGEWRLAVVVCSQVPIEEEERRRRARWEATETARRLQNDDPDMIKKRRKQTF